MLAPARFRRRSLTLHVRVGMPTVVLILLISSSALLLGPIILGGIWGGFWGIVSAPLLAFFGWFYLPGIILLVSTFWVLIALRPSLCSGLPRAVLMTVAAAVGAAYMGSFGPGGHTDWFKDKIPFLLGGAVSGAAAAWSITFLLPFAAQPPKTHNERP